MLFHDLPSMLLYLVIVGYTPGPSNLCAFHSGIHFGHRKAMKLWLGFLAAFLLIDGIIVLAVHFLGEALGKYVSWLSIAGAVYMVGMAVMILVNAHKEKEDKVINCNFKTGFIIELSNAKVWMFCIVALSTFVLPYSSDFLTLAVNGLVLIIAGPLANLVWLLAGGGLNKLTEKYGKLIDWILALALVASAIMIVLK